MTADWQLCLAAAERAARAAAEILAHWQQKISVREKSRNDLVTEADLAAQEAICQLLREACPEIGFVGEEAPSLESLPTGTYWVVDPLDGTTNYVHGLPCYAISIGLVNEGRPELGVVYDPTRQEMFTAARGRGAWLNGRAIRVSACERLEDALLLTGFPTDCRGKEHVFAAWRAFALQSRAVRRIGCTSLNLAWLAAGRADGCWSYEIHPWDVCAGICLIQEAGGTFTAPDGQPYSLQHRDFVASNSAIHESMIQLLRALS
ncbi:MAG: inositol monophosphatase family protein [Gemmatales bacterium]|nr:inositol monophosphatase [Gemmatales bacterium]MDW7995260.1 inositol monophosphatase family protein [Gemmatales bacterium]